MTSSFFLSFEKERERERERSNRRRKKKENENYGNFFFKKSKNFVVVPNQTVKYSRQKSFQIHYFWLKGKKKKKSFVFKMCTFQANVTKMIINKLQRERERVRMREREKGVRKGNHWWLQLFQSFCHQSFVVGNWWQFRWNHFNFNYLFLTLLSHTVCFIIVIMLNLKKFFFLKQTPKWFHLKL